MTESLRNPLVCIKKPRSL